MARDDARLAQTKPLTTPLELGIAKLRYAHLDAWSRLPREEAVATKLFTVVQALQEQKQTPTEEQIADMTKNIGESVDVVQRAVEEFGPNKDRPVLIRVRVAVVHADGRLVPDEKNGSPTAIMLVMTKF